MRNLSYMAVPARLAFASEANKFRAELAATKIDSPHVFLASPIVGGYLPRVPDQIVVKNAEEAR